MAMRCKRCRGAAVMEVRRHNAAFCRDCFLHYVGQQVTRAIAKYRMLGHTDRVLVAVSGGKDSLALWDLLLGLGYRVDGLYLSLGIGGYSQGSQTGFPGLRARPGRPPPSARPSRGGAPPPAPPPAGSTTWRATRHPPPRGPRERGAAPPAGCAG